MAFPIVATALSSGLGFLFGKSSGGNIDLLSGIEIGTKKEQTTITSTYAPFSPFIHQPTTDISETNINVIGSSGTSINATTKKETLGAQVPINYELPIQISVPQGSGASAGSSTGETATSGSGFNIYDILIVGLLAGGGYLVIKQIGNKKK